ncbi:class II glutamine amidotransferase [Xenorhabdus cabanillasii]|uniref:Glutamine amidotransferase n=2 Tax=Xenorhabdus cabanillasii TaxID=351673 RepID=A0A3D9UDS4_9GAMM|nr:class II glutamine amidotransferase [Xenorhabdus cabanillasii]PHM77530.1 class II glutamine amidotransferase [Xenorhabdus cabanillasii JM26]REF26523.1 glutamine amidotransferase [Xenorhabdus cabanillasii]CDL83889.1 putative glutamine amidotransferase yafJ [Xenorhabdus cabanillasii JM26]
MCELLGMNANVPTDIVFSLSGLIQRGGNTGPHRDGWGITFYEGLGYRTFKDHQPCYHSPVARFIQGYPIKSEAIIAHIRQANRGNVSLVNTHPFTRELWGRHWTYAHNGQLKGYRNLKTGNYRPVGETDSERAFCWILYQLSIRYPKRPANWSAVFRFIASLADELREKGVFNMLLSDGKFMMAYCSTQLHWITRRSPFGKATLLDQDIEIDFQQHTHPDDVVSVIATQPLTHNEAWNKIEPGSYALFHLGERML